MTLTTHAIVGAAAARIFSFNPILAFVAAFSSHFLIDAIPHWDYVAKSGRQDPENPMNNDMVIGRDFWFDLVRIGFDATLGVFLSLVIFVPTSIYLFGIIFFGACLGILPDPLQFVYWKFRREPMVSLQRFHIWIHTAYKKWTLERRWVIGVTAQFVLIVVVVWLAEALTKPL